MPAFAELPTAALVEIPAASAAVYSLAGGGSAYDYAEVLRVEHSAGIVPGKAFVSIRNLNAADENGHVTLQSTGALAPNCFKFWSRIRITSNGSTIFIGSLMKRRDWIAGNAAIFEFWDDRWLLSKIPIRGALVYDNYDNSVKFLPRYDCRTNPNGYKNCTRAGSLPGVADGDIYVFSEIPEQGTQTLANDAAVGNDDSAAPGQSIYWTPERFLKYLRALAFYAPPSPYAGNWAGLDATKVMWTAASCQFQDGPMRRMMPDLQFQGQAMLGAIQKTLDVSGDYQLHCDYRAGGQTALAFHVRDRSLAPARRTINLQRTGAAADVKTAFDGVAETDASELCTGVIVEGAAPLIESEFSYTNGGGDTLEPVWSAAEQTGFLQIISTGKDLAGNDLPGGSSGSLRNSKQALQAARLSFPKVYRAFQLKGGGLTAILSGAGGKYTNVPVLLDFKTPLAEQLQPYFESTGVRRGRVRVPVRIQVSANSASTIYHDVTYHNGFRISDDGIIWFDGLTDDLAGLDSIYDQALQSYTGGVAPPLRKIKINCAIPHDTRLFSAIDIFRDGVDPNSIRDQINESMNGTYGPALQRYILAADAYQQEHQVASNPVLSGSFQTSDGGAPPKLVTLTTLITAVIYDDSTQIKAHATRRHKDAARFKRSNTWKLPGIRLDFSIGDFIEKVSFRGAAASGEYKINAPLDHVTFDFRKQETVLRLE